MRTSKTYKVVMLPTEKASDLCLYTPQTHDVSNNILNYGNYNQRLYGLDKKPLYQHLYIISDEEIKEGDWLFFWDSGKLDSNKPQQYQPSKGHVLNNGVRKIVATTDKSLTTRIYPHSGGGIEDICYIPQIPESFIQAYIKAYNEGHPITIVDLEMEEDI